MDPPRPTRARRTSQKPSGGARLVGRSLQVGKRQVPLLSGALHYWRLAPDAWEPALKEMVALGLPLVETYAPWAAHERAPGTYDFGTEDPRLDLGRFLDLAHELGMLAIVRPGPHVNAEMTFFGIPERVIYDEACQARSAQDNAVILPFPPRMFPVPSYASHTYREEAGRWYDAVAAILRPRLWPQGPVAIVQVDNEATFYFRNGPYDQDYHPDAVDLYRRFLARRYDHLRDLGNFYGTEPESWGDVEPPRRFDAQEPEQLLPHLDWARFQESIVCDAVRALKKRLHEAGIDRVVTTHNVPLGDGGLPLNLPDLANVVDLAGFDYYHPAREHRTIKRRTLYLAGTFDLPYAPELGVGAPPWFTPLRHEDSLYCAMCALAFGLRGFNLYMGVDRDRWYGATVDAQGVPRVESAVWKHLIHQLQELRFHELSRRANVALILPQEYRRLSRATHLLGGILSPSALEALGGTPVDGCREDPLGFKGPIQVLWWRMLAKMSDALTRAGVPYVYVDSAAPDERLAGMQVVVSPSYEFAASARWQKLNDVARNGTLVAYGPAIPERDDRFRPHPFEVPRNGQRVFLDTPQDADEVVARWITELQLPQPFHASPEPVETTVHEDETGPRVLFVMNPDRAPVHATVELPGPMQLRDALTDERWNATTELGIALEGLTCRMLIVEQSSTEAQSIGQRGPSARRRAS